jgi:hypothetical protein
MPNRVVRPLCLLCLLMTARLPAAAQEPPASARVAVVRAGVILTLPARWEVSEGPVTRPGEEKLLTLGCRGGEWEDWQYVCIVRIRDVPDAHPDLARVAEGLKKALPLTYQDVKTLREGPRRIAGMPGFAMDASFTMEGRTQEALHRWFANGRRVVQFALRAGPAVAADALKQLDALMDAARALELPRGVDASDAALTRAIDATARMVKEATHEKLARLAGPPSYFLIRQGDFILGAAGYELAAENEGKGFKSTTTLWFRDLKGVGFAQTVTMTAAAGATQEAFRYRRRVLADGKPTGDEETIDAVVRSGRLSAERVRGASIDHLQQELPGTYAPQTLSGLYQRWFARAGRGQVLLTEFDFANFRVQDVLLSNCGREPIVLDGRPRAAVKTVQLQLAEGQLITTFHDPATGAPLRRDLGPLTLTPATLEEVRASFPEFGR